MARLAVRIVVLGLLLNGASVAADPPPTTASPPMLLEQAASVSTLEAGREHLFAFRMQAAEAAFRDLLDHPGGAAAAYHQLAMVALFKGLVTDDAVYFERFMTRSDSLRRVLADHPDSPWKRQLAAATSLQRTVARGKLGQYVRAALAARSAYKGFEALVEEHPDFAEAYMGMGLLHLTVASLPAGYRTLLSVLGFGGTASEGLRELEYAATHSRYNRELAHMSIALAQIVILDQIPQGTERLGRLYQRHSESLLYAHLYGYALYTNRQPRQAEAVLQPAVDQQSAPDYFYIDYLDYYLGEVRFVQDDYEAAIVAYRRYLARHDGPALRAMGQYRLGLALEMMGRREAAASVYRQVEAPRDFDNDLVARRRAHVRLERPMTALERRLIRGVNAFYRSDYGEAQATLRAIFHDPSAAPVLKARAAFYIGRVHHVQERYAQAYPAYVYAVEHPGNPRAEWGPWAQLRIADMYAEQGQTRAAIQAYRKALDWDRPFDYYHSLEQKARIALERLDGS